MAETVELLSEDVLAGLDEMLPRLHITGQLAQDLVSIARWAARIYDDVNGWQYDGCFTGDCPHATDAECTKSQARAYKELCDLIEARCDELAPPTPEERR